jgi:hypothetical protein
LTKVFVDCDEILRRNRLVKAKQPNPTAAELEILRVLWENGPHSARDVQKTLNAVKPTGYTTVLNSTPAGG